MKKIFLILSAAILAVGLTACGGAAEEREAELKLEPLTPVTDAPSAAPEMNAAGASETDAEEPADPAVSAAQDCVGQPVEALYAAVGEPVSAEYGTSCLEENAEDGMLYYDGFYVWTVRTESEELVHAVYAGG